MFFDTEEFGVIQFGPVGPTVVNKNVQKFTMFTNNRATLVSASTNLPGKLVLESVRGVRRSRSSAIRLPTLT